MQESKQYIENIARIVDEVQRTQLPHIEQAALAFCETVQGGGRVFLFGTGHSHMFAEELFYRAGGFASVRPILEDGLMLHASATNSTQMERIAALAQPLFEDYGIRAGDLLLIASNSGRNALPVEMAALAKERGVKVIALTSMQHSGAVTPRNARGKRLFELADVVLDNCGSLGDACIPVGDVLTSPTSTVIGAMLLNAMVARAAAMLAERGVEPEVFASSNVDGGDAKNAILLAKYKGNVRGL